MAAPLTTAQQFRQLALVVSYAFIACTLYVGYSTAMTVAGYEMFSARHPRTKRTDIVKIAALGSAVVSLVIAIGTFLFNHWLPAPRNYIQNRPRYGYWFPVFALVFTVVLGDAIGYWILGAFGVRGEGGPSWDSFYSFGFVGGLPVPGFVYLVGCLLDFFAV